VVGAEQMPLSLNLVLNIFVIIVFLISMLTFEFKSEAEHDGIRFRFEKVYRISNIVILASAGYALRYCVQHPEISIRHSNVTSTCVLLMVLGCTARNLFEE
jgi:hypothetical protein